jgi:hypothetical protein
VAFLHRSKSCRELRKSETSKLLTRKTIRVPNFLHFCLVCSCARNFARNEEFLKNLLRLAVPPGMGLWSGFHLDLLLVSLMLGSLAISLWAYVGSTSSFKQQHQPGSYSYKVTAHILDPTYAHTTRVYERLLPMELIPTFLEPARPQKS